MKFTFSQQHDASDCGAACLKMVVEYYGRKVELQQLRELCYVNKDGVTMLGISDAAEIVGFRTMGVKIDLHKLLKKMVLPCIIHWRQSHFVVVYDINVKNELVNI